MVVTLKRCTQRTPEALCGDLRPLPQCSLTTPTGTHTGDHRSSHTIPQVGKIVFRWKGARRKGKYRPQITLPVATNPYLTGNVKRKPECACPDWWTGHGHTKPCRLVEAS
jgi:hypothetical protein